MRRRLAPDTRPRTPDERAEAIIGDLVAADVVDQLAVVRRHRQSLTQGRRFRPRHRNQLIHLESALQAAQRHLEVLQRRQAAWLSDRTFDRNLVERVLLLACIADFHKSSAVALQQVRMAVEVVGARDGPSAVIDEVDRWLPPEIVGGTSVQAVTDYLRRHFPPVA